MRPTHWLSMIGQFTTGDDTLTFRGGAPDQEVPAGPYYQNGVFVSDLEFGGGAVSSTITFAREPLPYDPALSLAGLILLYVPATGGFVTVQLGGMIGLVSVQTFVNGQWTTHAAHGQSRQIEPDRPYELSAVVTGSRVAVTLDGIQVVDVNLPFTLPRGQAGIWAAGPNDVKFKGFDVKTEPPTLFVVMQFTDPFNELYRDVIKPVGIDAGYTVMRADEAYGPGM